METLEAIHRYLHPERYDAAAEPREWDADTLDEVARMVDAAVEGGGHVNVAIGRLAVAGDEAAETEGDDARQD